ncbi:hypothetical protein H009_02468 [Agrobacterium tumefaciens str. Cherry 2E-2-2]|nr:hypothetical protein H009_02468 [Agrobacterium tumefaciens str. Cherry 2E-2-2]
MKTNRSVIKIFLGSPGDLVDERRAAKRIVDEENRNHANALGYHIELVGWEDTVAQHGRAQEIINRDLVQCDYFVGIVWKRWGTPPGPAGTPYSSGFQEEYEQSERRFEETGKPAISILFKDINDEDKRDVGPQLEQVLKFKKRFTEEYRGAYQTFTDLRDFEHRFRSIVALSLRSEIDEESNHPSEEKSIERDSQEVQKLSSSAVDDSIFESTAHSFLLDLIGRKQRDKGFEYSAAEAARFRLLAHSLQLSQNDNEALGVHDANLIYREMRDAELSDREKRWLIRSGLAHYGASTAPLWHWLLASGFSPSTELAFATFASPDFIKKNAFKALGDLQDDLQGMKGMMARQKLVELWLSSKDNDLLVSALGYLGECGLTDDLEAIDKHIDASQATVSLAAVRARIEILSRKSMEEALDFLSGREDADISKGLAGRILANPSVIETSLLQRCLGNRSIDFRRAVAAELLARDAIDREQAVMLTESPDAATRVIGARAIGKHLAEFSLSDARTVIIKPKKSGGLLSQGYDHDGEKMFDEYKHEFLIEKNRDDLEFRRSNEGVYSNEFTLALYDKYFKIYHQEIVENINDEFAAYFLVKCEKMPNPSSRPDDKLLAFLRSKLFYKAILLICRKNSRSDLPLIRRKIDEADVQFSTLIVVFLGRFGDWSDVKRIIRLCNNFPFDGLSLLSYAGKDNEYAIAAKVALDLADGRVADLLSCEMPSGLRQAIFRSMSRNIFTSFDNAQIERWLGSEIESVRQAVAMKIVQSLPKKRVKQILESYTGDEKTYYYNALFWLDLGVAADKRCAVSVSERFLARAASK